MKNITTLLALLLLPAISIAETPKVTIGGYLETYAGYSKQEDAYRKAGPTNGILSLDAFNSGAKLSNYAIVNDARLHIDIDSQKDNCKYGGHVSVNANTGGKSTTGRSSTTDKLYIYLQNDKVGRLELGSNRGAGTAFELYKATHIKALYGIEGHWGNWVSNYSNINIPGLGNFITKEASQHSHLWKPSLPTNQSSLYYNDANKITFYTQPSKNLTVGLSFIPDLDHIGAFNWPTKTGGATNPDRSGLRSTFKNIFSGGFKYNNKIGNFQYHSYLAAEIGKAKHYGITDLTHDLKAFETGLFIIRNNITFGVSYGDWFKTNTYKTRFANTKQGTKYWTIVASHNVTDKLEYSISYMHSKKAGGLEFLGGKLTESAGVIRHKNFSDATYNRLNLVSIGVQYKAMKGFMPYSELTFFNFDGTRTINDKNNKGLVFLNGARLSF